MRARTIEVEAALTWKFSKTKEGSYIAVCDPIGQTVQADGFSTLIETINEAIDSLFRELLSTDDLARFLKERGWTPGTELPSNPRERKNVRFDVPFDLKQVKRRDLVGSSC